MQYSFLTVDVDARGVALVGLNRPEVHNAFDAALIGELTAAFGALNADESVRLAVLYGHGKSFCAGGDLNWMRAMVNYSVEENKADSQKLSDMFATISGFSKPLIGVVHGNALGGGSGLAAVCDYVLATDTASFGFTETRLGLLPAVIGPYAIEKIGIGAARAYFISGMRFDAATAQRIGLVHQITSGDQLPTARETLIGEFLKAAPQASVKAKSLARTMHALPISIQHDLAIEAISDARVSAEGQAGMKALLEGGKPPWSAS
ncbi:MAG: enoyl-CoA hydratase/isomerase family protein [Alphaproteobacteria bacterium]|nr:enoyl-CoA hydratase/isomerase family protein [Alphaproteobacteria bacterium]